MKRFRFELILAVALLALFALFWRFQAPGGSLAHEETERYIQAIDRQVTVLGPGERADFFARLRDFAAQDDGKPVYMLNLMRYHDKLGTGPGMAAGYQGSPAQSNKFYEDHVMPLALKIGASPLFAGEVSGRNVVASTDAEDHWSRIILMRYPNRRAFFELVANPEYANYVAYKFNALHLGLVPVSGELLLPDPRMLAAAILLLLFLLVAWMRALKQARNPMTAKPERA